MDIEKKVKYKIWMTVEKYTVYEDGEEEYEDIDDFTVSVTECDFLKEAEETMEEIHSNYSKKE